ncbi:peptidylprolyl isomerase [Candidatus Latescibacterota bacterium]
MLRIVSLALALAAVAMAGCGQQSDEVQVSTETLMDPSSPELNQTAPDQFKVQLETSVGAVTIQVNRDWAPLGSDRFYNLVKAGFYDGQRFFRVVPNFVVQWGMHGDPEVMKNWVTANFRDDPVKTKNVRGAVTFAKTGAPNSRSTQLFINLKDNLGLDRQGFAPFGTVVEGLDVVDAINPEYANMQVDQQQIGTRGNEYLNKNFPNLDYIVRATVVE